MRTSNLSLLNRRGALHTVKTWALRHRRLCIAGLLCAAVGIGVQAFIPVSPTQRQVVVTTTELAPGTEISAASLKVVSVAFSLVPEHSLTDIDEAVGKRVASPIDAGAVLSSTHFVGPGLLTGLPGTMAAVPLAPSDSRVLTLLRPGAHVDVYVNTESEFGGSNQTQLVATRATVLWVQDHAHGGVLDTTEEPGLVVIAVPKEQSGTLVAAGRAQQTSLVLTD